MPKTNPSRGSPAVGEAQPQDAMGELRGIIRSVLGEVLQETRNSGQLLQAHVEPAGMQGQQQVLVEPRTGSVYRDTDVVCVA